MARSVLCGPPRAHSGANPAHDGEVGKRRWTDAARAVGALVVVSHTSPNRAALRTVTPSREPAYPNRSGHSKRLSWALIAQAMGRRSP